MIKPIWQLSKLATTSNKQAVLFSIYTTLQFEDLQLFSNIWISFCSCLTDQEESFNLPAKISTEMWEIVLPLQSENERSCLIRVQSFLSNRSSPNPPRSKCLQNYCTHLCRKTLRHWIYCIDHCTGCYYSTHTPLWRQYYQQMCEVQEFHCLAPVVSAENKVHKYFFFKKKDQLLPRPK